ncbi:hypothetical protein AYO37_01095 [Opitutia bacterium SCGC AG-212-L18]|nr:hypothetical protein AYO37_01095 [Opitutae bacterium SCGC AG-212-L18]
MNIKSYPTIDCRNNGGLKLFSKSEHKPKAPLDLDNFTKSVDKVLIDNPLKLPYSYSQQQLQGMGRGCQVPIRANQTARSAHGKTCMSRFFNNKKITDFLLRSEVATDQFGIPLYTPNERKIYDFSTMPHIFFRNSNWTRCPQEKALFGFGEMNDNEIQLREEYNQILYSMEKTRADIENPYKGYLAFNMMYIGDNEIKTLLLKNKTKFEKYKEKQPKLNGIHYIETTYTLGHIKKLIDSIESKSLPVDDQPINLFVFIFNFGDHSVCGTLSINNEDKDHPKASEMFFFDSLVKNDANNNSISSFKEHLKELNIRTTYICYEAQADGAEKYEVDYNCVLYSLRTTNKLIELLASNEESPLRTRLLSLQPSTDTDDHLFTYSQEIAKRYPDFFEYDSISNTYKPKSFKNRQLPNTAARWYLGRLSLKELIKTHQ